MSIIINDVIITRNYIISTLITISVISVASLKTKCYQHYSLFIYTMTSRLGCDEFICNIVYSLMS